MFGLFLFVVGVFLAAFVGYVLGLDCGRDYEYNRWVDALNNSNKDDDDNDPPFSGAVQPA